MSPFVLILGLVLLGDVTWWLWADAQLRRTHRSRLWRTILTIFVGSQLLYLVWFIAFPEQGRHAHQWLPSPVLAAVYLWHLLILPASLLAALGFGMISLIARWRSKTGTASAAFSETAETSPEISTLSRRQILAAGMVALPPLFLTGTVARSMRQIHQFRINRIELALNGLPPELDGMTIAHVSDLHIGRFTRAGMLPKIADATNALKADLTLMTGDLIDLTLSDLPAGIDFLRRLDPRSGLFICEGNHDLIENPLAFVSRMRSADMPLLLDRAVTAYVRNRPVQLMGLSWARGDTGIGGAMNRLTPQRNEGAFQILLAHHPHAFDPAAAMGIPLTLAGHTHGGQLMLNERLGAGPAMFRYWTGLYRKNDSALIVSNGVGNWFPLRINAPAEIVHITLRSGGQA